LQDLLILLTEQLLVYKKRWEQDQCHSGLKPAGKRCVGGMGEDSTGLQYIRYVQ
jgi:hypothetical protein